MRILALPADAPLWRAVDAEQERADELQKVRDIDNVLEMFKPKEG